MIALGAMFRTLRLYLSAENLVMMGKVTNGEEFLIDDFKPLSLSGWRLSWGVQNRLEVDPNGSGSQNPGQDWEWRCRGLCGLPGL